MAIKLAGMVTLYKPSKENISNIKNYNQVDYGELDITTKLFDSLTDAVNYNSVSDAVAGGAVYTEGAAVGTISGSTFTGNNATKADHRANGGAVKVQFGGEAIIKDCNFVANEAPKGAAIDLQANTGEPCKVTVIAFSLSVSV